MDRRSFLIATGAVLALPRTSFAAALQYQPGMVGDRLKNGETVFLDFTATWCSTCQAQGRVINALKAANPAYEQAITFIDVDWDSYKGDALTKSLRIPRRSTLVVLKGDKELGRIIAQTSESAIKSLMDTALAAATG
ncbi:thioredoxin family protein [Thalassococcus sp. CAU 1522]|uniref:Thioredoxin family protein n=1 Tax=Thalassococcus arenae TaxID=2851652 RepID=A0ABS6N4A1_9RHOB|nr:thioredoxin family protein [Thalassococcus arenae]MBV2358850.1 thioredoxin family protein [Thalassococcus arenae]